MTSRLAYISALMCTVPCLARIGYSTKHLAEQFEARPAEIAKFMKGKLDSERTQELADAMRKAGLPV